MSNYVWAAVHAVDGRKSWGWGWEDLLPSWNHSFLAHLAPGTWPLSRWTQDAHSLHAHACQSVRTSHAKNFHWVGMVVSCFRLRYARRNGRLPAQLSGVQAPTTLPFCQLALNSVRLSCLCCVAWRNVLVVDILVLIIISFLVSLRVGSDMHLPTRTSVQKSVCWSLFENRNICTVLPCEKLVLPRESSTHLNGI